MANSEGGCLVVGVSETAKKTLEPTGLASLRDKADVENGIRSFLPQALMDTITVMDFSYEAAEYAQIVGKSFQILIVQNDPQNLPFMSLSESTGICKAEIYVRRMASTEVATYEELQAIINRRIATGHSTDHALDLNEHLDDLRKLYGQIEHFHRQNPMRRISSDMFSSSIFGIQKESFEQFIERMIVVKKREIERLLCG